MFIFKKLSNLKAIVTQQKCMNIWNFNFDPFHVELGPYGYFFDKTNSKNNCHVCNWLVFIKN